MNEDLLRLVAAELNFAPEAGERAVRVSALVQDTNGRIAAEAIGALPFDSSPYGFPDWLAAADKS
ncbi:MAG: hypothetical protein JWQ94_1602 [Tardiphaga sp.]|jgi:hypothetical protein|nr:hypothetical protein [Tardiphaga sp.]